LTGTLPCGARTFLGGHEFRRVCPDGSGAPYLARAGPRGQAGPGTAGPGQVLARVPGHGAPSAAGRQRPPTASP